MLKELPAIEEKIKAIPPFKFTNGNRFLVELPLKNFGQFDFDNMTKLLGIRYLECDPYSTHVVINHDSIFMSNPFSNFDGEPLKFNHSFASLPASITQHFVPDTRDCTFNMPFDDEEVAEQIDVAAADGSLSIWGVVNYDSDVKWGIPTGRVESLIFAKAKLTRESRDYQFITEVKATNNDTWPTYIEHLQAEHGHVLSKLKKDKTGQKLAVYQRDIALLKSTAGKAFYDISNHKSDNRNARKSTVFGGFNPENGYFEVLFSGGTLGNTAYSSLVQYELVEYEGMLTGVLKHVVSGGNRRIPKVLLFDVSSGHQPLFYIRYRCERYQCGSTNFKLNNGFSYSQFQEWKAAATKKQVL